MDRKPPGRAMFPPPGKFSAARSHVMNDKYMEDFEKAWEELHGMHLGEGAGGELPAGGGAGRRTAPGGAGAAAAAARAGTSLAAHQRNVYAALEDSMGASPYGSPYGGGSAAGMSYGSSASGGYGGRPIASPSRGTRPPPASRTPPPLRPASGAPSSRSNPPPLPAVGSSALTSSSTSTPTRRTGGPRASSNSGSGGPTTPSSWRYPPRVSPAWVTGPTDPAGVLCDLSDRPNACSAADWGRGEVVIGSTDHALYVLDAARGLKKRTLYSKTSGHVEWVTCVTFASEGRIVSGGMDSKLWAWPAAGNKGTKAEAHFGPISQVKYDRQADVVVSASYDKTIRLWQLGARVHELGCLQGHEAPVLEMQVHSTDSRIVSGDRSGHVLLWDTSSGGVSWRMKNVHQGHVTSLAWFDSDGGEGGGGGSAASGPGGSSLTGCFVTGGQDGVVRVWDPRMKLNVAKVQLHVNEQGVGAVGDIIAGGPATGGLVVTAGADRTARTLDPRLSFALAATVRLTDFPYSMIAAGGVAAVGCGDGAIHFVDISSGRTLYALGANRAAVRCMEASYDKLVCSGDDGKAIVYSFS